MEEAGSISTSVVLKLSQALLPDPRLPLPRFADNQFTQCYVLGRKKKKAKKKKNPKKHKPTLFLTACNNTFFINKLFVYM